jgi:hypothetical protein
VSTHLRIKHTGAAVILASHQVLESASTIGRMNFGLTLQGAHGATCFDLVATLFVQVAPDRSVATMVESGLLVCLEMRMSCNAGRAKGKEEQRSAEHVVCKEGFAEQ